MAPTRAPTATLLRRLSSMVYETLIIVALPLMMVADWTAMRLSDATEWARLKIARLTALLD